MCKMKEWNSPYNPFNSRKVFLWREHLEGCANLNFLPPVTVSIDPSNKCNFNCIWCNAFECMQSKQVNLSGDHLMRLADFYAEWGIKSACVAGGGEPFMNSNTGKMLLRLKENGVGCAPVTNGSLLTDEIIEIIAFTSRWSGISVDAACNETYMKVKGISNPKIFNVVLDNISKLTKQIRDTKSECEVGFKFLLHPLNANEILDAVKLAKSLGVHDFQLRPVGWDNNLKTKGKSLPNFLNLKDTINEQLEQAMELEDEDFYVYGIRHKFQSDFQRKIGFKRCWASPIATLVFEADGSCNICIDRRGDENTVLCSHFPDPYEVLKHWNSNRHKRILQNVNPKNCPRCTIGPYNEVVEQVIIKDRMCRDFL